jgi:Na+-driven multidrug efflux pump
MLMATLFFGRTTIPRVFTRDTEVVAVTQKVMPLLAMFMVGILSLQCGVHEAWQCDRMTTRRT